MKNSICNKQSMEEEKVSKGKYVAIKAIGDWEMENKINNLY